MLLVTAALFVAAPAPEGHAQPVDPPPSPTVPREALVRFHKVFPPAWQIVPLAGHARLIAPGIQYNKSLAVWRLPMPPGISVDDAVNELLADPRVEIAQPNYRYTNAVAPDDPFFAERQQPRMQVINAPAGWDIETGSADVIVAVIDGGVDVTHPELFDSIWTNPAEIPDNGIDDDKNKCVDDVHGCHVQALPPDGDIRDRDGHGTFVSGIIAANTNNGAGIAGIAWNATIMPVRALDPSGFGETEQLAEAILYAARNGADVINMSLALTPLGTTCPTDAIVEDAMRVAHDDFGATLVAAAGNFNVSCVSHPASSQYAIAVSAAGPPQDPDARAYFSQWGTEVDVTAPGELISSTCPLDPEAPTSFCSNGSYGIGNGTSFSTPMVSGLAALLLSRDPSLSNDAVGARIRETAMDLPDETHEHWDGSGMIDVAAALGAPSAHAFIDFRGPDTAGVHLRVQVGSPSKPLCSTDIWAAPEMIHGHSVRGTFGVAECAALWPPSPERPWTIIGSAESRKKSVLNGLALIAGKDSCSASHLPRWLTQVDVSVAMVTCDATGLVPNDEVAGAVQIDPASVPRRFDQDVRYATALKDPGSSCTSSSSHSAWYRLAPAATSMAIAADTFGSSFDTVLAVFREDGSALEEVACNDEFAGSQSRVVWRVASGASYLIMAAASAQTPAGSLRLNLSPAYPPSNDEQDEPAALAFAEVLQGAYGATSDPQDPPVSCVASYGYSVWFTIDMAEGIHAISTAGSDYDTVVAVFRRETDGATTEVACNDDAAQGGDPSFAAWDSDGGEHLVLVGAFRNKPARVLHLVMASEDQ